jgi:hypothetical protein
MTPKKIGTIFVRRLVKCAMLRLTQAAGSPYTVLHRTRETSHTMTAAVATPRVDLHLAPAVSRHASAVRRYAATAARPVDMPHSHVTRAGAA